MNIDIVVFLIDLTVQINSAKLGHSWKTGTVHLHQD